MRDSADRTHAQEDSTGALPDRLVAGRYRLARQLGRGGMGVVWLAHDTDLDRDVALKELRPPPGLPEADHAVFRQRAQQEARSAAHVRHPNAVTLYDVLSGTGDGTVYLVMELISGPTLAELIQRDGPLHASRAARIGLQLLDVLAAAHALGIVHRDVKPGNILIAANDQVKLTDFGIAHTMGDPRLTRTGVMGTPAYQAPELFESAPITPAADLWSLGATLYYATDGHGPFDRNSTGATLRAIVLDDVPAPRCEPHLAAVITHMLQRDPAQRATIGQARAELHQVPAHEPATPADPAQPGLDAAEPSGSPDQEPRWNPEEETRRRPDAPPPLATPHEAPAKRGLARRLLTRNTIAIATGAVAVAGGALGLLATSGGPVSHRSTPGPPHALTSTSPKSPLAEDPAGQLVAFVNSSGQLACDHYASGWHGPTVLPGIPRPGSPILVGLDGVNVFFIERDGTVVDDYNNPQSGWQGPSPIGGTAEAGSGLALFHNNSTRTRPAVVFVNTSGKLAYDQYTAGWHGPAVLPGNPRPGSPIAVSPNGESVFFIEHNGAVTHDVRTPGPGWRGPLPAGGTAEAGSGLAFSPGTSTAGTHPAIIFTNTSGKLAYDQYTTGWHGPDLLPGTPRPGTPIAWGPAGTSVYFIESNGKVATDYLLRFHWRGSYPTGGTAAPGSALTYAPGDRTVASRPNLVFTTSGVLTYDWYAGRWHGPAPLTSGSR